MPQAYGRRISAESAAVSGAGAAVTSNLQHVLQQYKFVTERVAVTMPSPQQGMLVLSHCFCWDHLHDEWTGSHCRSASLGSSGLAP